MTRSTHCLLLAAALLAPPAAAPPARAAGGAAAPADSAAPAPIPIPDDALCAPLILDPQDYGLGTSVIYRRIPSPQEIAELQFVGAFHQLVIALGTWPATYAELQPLERAPLPQGSQVVVLLSGWPPTREAVQAWNYLHLPLRVILVVPGPPTDRGVMLDLNRMAGLERVIAEMPEPSQAGFERLQRPLSFRVVRR